MSGSLRVGELATILGTTTKTLRFYEDIGLISGVTRNQSRYRLYGADAVSRAQLVFSLRRLGLSIDNLKVLFNGDNTQQLRRSVLGVLDEKLFNLDRDLGVLQGQREELATRHQALLLTPRDKPPNCICAVLLTTCTCDKD